MNNEKPQHIAMQTPDGRQLAIDTLAQVIPSCFTEAKGDDGELHKVVDFTKLRQLLGDAAVEDAPEVYDFTWVGKRAAMREAAAPIRKTLRPCPEESVDWDTTQNLYIEGDNLEVLKLLQNSYMGKVKMIYIDPPYNTGTDLIYNDNRRLSEDDYNVSISDDQGNRLVVNKFSNGTFHSDWCSMIYKRLLVCRALLSDEGVIFISIDDKELDNLKKICNELYGESNFVANMIWQSTAGSNTGTDIVTVTENILVYTKCRDKFTFDGKLSDEESFSLVDEYVETRGKYSLDKMDRRRVAGHYSDALNFPIQMPDGSLRWPGGTKEKNNEGWNYLWSKTKVEWGIKNGFIVFKESNGEWSVYNKRYSKVDNEGNQVERTIPFRNLITSDQSNTAQGTSELRDLFSIRPFDFPKPTSLLKQLFLTSVRRNKDAIILDFFSGSGTTADAVMQMNAEDKGSRKFILVQAPEKTDVESEPYKAGLSNICEIGKERIRRAGRKIKEENPDAKDLDIGFRVFKCAESNYKDVAFTPKDYSQESLDMFVDNIKEKRTDLDLLFDCMLRWGVQLSMPIQSSKVDGCTIHNVDDGSLVACFDGTVTEKVIDAIAAMSPVRVVFRDSSFTEASTKMNLFELFKQKCNWSDEEVKKNVRVI